LHAEGWQRAALSNRAVTVIGIYDQAGNVLMLRTTRKRARRDFAALYGCKWNVLWRKGFRVHAC
jgi:hypothetical protein